jgi:hypothetical protein
MPVKWLVASMSALTALTLTVAGVAGVPRAAVADAPPACTLEWALLGGCPTSDTAVAAHPAPVSPVLVKVSGL